MNYISHHDGAFELLRKITGLCPIMSEYRLLYPESTRLQQSLSTFYASIVRCCQHMVQVMQRRGKICLFMCISNDVI